MSPLLFCTTHSSVDTLPSLLDSWGRYKGLKRQGCKDNVNIDSSLWNPEAIFTDVISYPKMDIHQTGLDHVLKLQKRAIPYECCQNPGF